MAVPSFFLVGAPKCGTTSLCHYLRQHPDVFIPDRKELHFFGSDLDITRYYDTASEYLDQFACTTKTMAGEGTTWYLFSRTAAQEIYKFNRDARIIISVRKPIDMVYSLFRFRRYEGIEQSPFFPYVLDREKEYIESLQSVICIRHNYIYSKAALYYGQVKRYMEIFGTDRVHIILFEELRDNPKEVYRGILKFLGVCDDFRPQFRNVNKTGQFRSERFRERLDHPPRVVKRLAYALPQRFRRGAYRVLRRVNISYAPPPPLDRALRRRLTNEFRPDVERLGALIGRDLTHWLAE